MSQTYQPKKRKRARTHGFLVRSRTKTGKKVLLRRSEKDEKNFLYNSLSFEIMLPKKNRVDKKTIERIFKEGKFINSPKFNF